MPTHTVDTRALQDGQAPLVLSSYWPLLSPGLSLGEQVATIRVMHECLRQLPRPPRDQALFQFLMTHPPNHPSTHLNDDAVAASVCVVAVGILSFVAWLLLR